MTSVKERYGSFHDSLKAPVHRWFTYPAGYSYKLVQAKIAARQLGAQHWLADPFLGSGTTSLVAKLTGLNSVGIEAHPFVFWVAQTKLNFDHDPVLLKKNFEEVIARAKSIPVPPLAGIWPPLIYKCFSDENLKSLYALRKAVLELDGVSVNAGLLKLALTSALRTITTAGAGWPYIAPSKYAKRLTERDAFEEFRKQGNHFVSDIRQASWGGISHSEHRLVLGDAREFDQHCAPDSIDLIITSPPYLNNYDYADRTRLETYFWGIYDSWGEITREVRDRLITAATTQVRISQMNDAIRCPGILEAHPELHRELQNIIGQLATTRKTKPGRKTYDLMVAGYFEDMLKVLKGSYNVLKPGGQFILVLGDSAPYGIHVPTDEIIGKLAHAIGFANYDLEVIRTRGDKWANNPQRHKVGLRESILTVIK